MKCIIRSALGNSIEAISCAVFVLLLTLGAATSPCAADQDSKNLLSNGDFEADPNSSSFVWLANNWAHNDATMQVITDRPHGGKQCFQMTLTHANHADNIQLLQSIPKMTPGRIYNVTFWIRGSEAGSVEVGLNQMAPPWSVMVVNTIKYGTDWAQETVQLALPFAADADKMALVFTLRHETSIWLDDIALTEGPMAPVPPPLEGNLISNGDFEIGETSPGYAWSPNNWAKNDADMKTDTDNPHGGQRSQKLGLLQATHADNIQFNQMLPKLLPGRIYNVGFWVRGSDNCPPLEVAFNQMFPPWGTLSGAKVSYGSEWSHHVVRLTLPIDAIPSATALVFTLRHETTIWLDDVSVTEAPRKSTEQPLLGNLVPNGSFEVGRVNWTASMPYWSDGRGILSLLAGNVDSWNIESVPTPDAPNGKRALHFKLAPSRQGIDTLNLTSAFFPLRYGYPVQVSFWLKAEQPGGQIWAAIVNGQEPATTQQASTFNISKAGWQKYQFSIQASDSPDGLYFFQLRLSQPGDFWLDAVSVTDADAPEATYATRAHDVGWEQVGPEHIGNLYLPSEPVQFRILAEKNPAGPVQLTGRVVDLFGKAVKTLNLTLTGDDRAETVLDDLPRDRLGAYKIELFPPGADFDHDVPAIDLQYLILPKLPPLASVKDRYFGSHASSLGAGMLKVSELVGVRSIRFHRPELSKWAFLEPDRGKLLLDQIVPPIAHASSLGFDLYGSLDLTPDWDADYVAGEPLGWRGEGAYPPKDWAPYHNYVQQVTQALKPYVHSWELWNEPELDEFLTVPSSWHDGRAKLVQKLVKETRQALDEAHSDIELNGVADYDINSPLTDQLMDLKVWSDLDGATFHAYTLDASGLEGRVQKLSQQLDRHGKPVNIWMSEGANSIHADTWLRSPRIPDAAPSSALLQAAGTVRNLAEFKAMGVKRYYTYPGPWDWGAGRQMNDNMWSFGADAQANPLPSWSAHAACVLFLEGADPDPAGAIEHVTVGGIPVTLLHFVHPDGKRVIVAWSKTPVPVAQVPPIAGLHFKAFDLCGNEISNLAELYATPVYLMP